VHVSDAAAHTTGAPAVASQSVLARHSMPTEHAAQGLPPPQSTSVSRPFFTPSLHVAGGAPLAEGAPLVAAEPDGVCEGDAPRERLAVGVTVGVAEPASEPEIVLEGDEAAAALVEGEG